MVRRREDGGVGLDCNSLHLDVLQLSGLLAGDVKEREMIARPRSSNGGRSNPASYFVRSGGPMVKKLILAVKEGGVSGSGLLCRTSLLAFLFTLPAFNRGRGYRFFEVFCGYGDQVPTCKITMRNKHAFSHCTYNWLHDFLVGFALLRGHH
jgi:hypothetical protein